MQLHESKLRYNIVRRSNQSLRLCRVFQSEQQHCVYLHMNASENSLRWTWVLGMQRALDSLYSQWHQHSCSIFVYSISAIFCENKNLRVWVVESEEFKSFDISILSFSVSWFTWQVNGLKTVQTADKMFSPLSLMFYEVQENVHISCTYSKFYEKTFWDQHS